MEKISWLFSIIGIDLTLWITYFTGVFENDYGKAVIFVTSIVFAIAVVSVAVMAYKAYQVKEENLDIENLIKDIENEQNDCLERFLF